jgi:hypothetical protein
VQREFDLSLSSKFLLLFSLQRGGLPLLSLSPSLNLPIYQSPSLVLSRFYPLSLPVSLSLLSVYLYLSATTVHSTSAFLPFISSLFLSRPRSRTEGSSSFSLLKEAEAVWWGGFHYGHLTYQLRVHVEVEGGWGCGKPQTRNRFYYN